MRALLHGGDRALHRPEAGHDDDLRRGRDLERAAQHGEAVQGRHLEVGEHHLERLGEQPRERSLAALRLGHVVARLLEHERGGGAHVALIVDDQDARFPAGGELGRRLGSFGHRKSLEPRTPPR